MVRHGERPVPSWVADKIVTDKRDVGRGKNIPWQEMSPKPEQKRTREDQVGDGSAVGAKSPCRVIYMTY